MFLLLVSWCAIVLEVASGRQPAPPHHSADHLPDTQFSCRDKVLGGYYADPDAQCQMFHVCVKVAGVGIQDFRFLCPNGTAFDQEAQICAGWADVACEPAALYYSSDNFDLYRIGSGFESKKAPVTFEDEPDFHLQRAEPDIFSGAHSSNFFNNREGKDSQDPHVESRAKSVSKNQYEQPQKKKVVRKLQRRPVETSPRSAPTNQGQFTNNFAGSYVPTTSKATTTTTVKAVTTSQYNENNNYNQRQNKHQSFRQSPSSTAAPVDYYKSTADYQNYNNQDQTSSTAHNARYNARSFKSRQPSTPEYNYNAETESVKNKPKTTLNYNYNGASDASSNKQSYSEYSEQTTPKYNFNKERKPKYENQQSSPQYNYNNQDQYSKVNQQTTPKLNNEYNQKNYSPSTNNNNYKTTQQSSSSQSQQYSNVPQTTSQQTYSADNTQFDKVKSTTKHTEKKQYYNAKYEHQQSSQQTPTPKYNTNLQYDNNQQSTPFYNHNSDFNQQYKTPEQQQYSTVSPSISSRGSTFNQQKSTEQQYSTSVPSSSSRGSTHNQQKSTEQQHSTAAPSFSSRGSTYNQQKSTSDYQQYSSSVNNNVQQKSTGVIQQSTARSTYQQYSTPDPYKPKEEDYDDGQYHPEIYEREAGGEYDVTARKNVRYEQPAAKTSDQELLKAAHSINIAASGNELARDNRPHSVTTFSPVSRITRPTTQAPKTANTTPVPKAVYSGIAGLTSAAPRPFTARPVVESTSPPVKKPAQHKQPEPQKHVAKAQTQQAANAPKASSPAAAAKDTSYDYAYYDNTDHYNEYENIEEFGRTSKKQ